MWRVPDQVALNYMHIQMYLRKHVCLHVRMYLNCVFSYADMYVCPYVVNNVISYADMYVCLTLNCDLCEIQVSAGSVICQKNTNNEASPP